MINIKYQIKSIPNFPDYYADTDGNIWSSKRNKFIKLKAVKRKFYYQISLVKDSKIYTKNIHPLILKVFVGDYSQNLIVCHNDDNGFNNILSNLRWDTHKNNSRDMINNGNVARGSRQGSSKLTENQALDIKYKSNLSSYKLGKIYNVDPTTIQKIRNGVNWNWL